MLPMIRDNVLKMLAYLPAEVKLVVAAKGANCEEVRQSAEAGAEIVGVNYLQEAEEWVTALGNIAQWHFIGHLQKNKVRKAVKIFDMIQTVDSFELAVIIDKECAKINKVMPVLIEVNSACEPQKAGAMPQDVEALAESMAALSNLRLRGLMTMGPISENPEHSRMFFSDTKLLFDKIKNNQGKSWAKWDTLSMGMSNSWRIAVEEGTTMVRIGTAIFGQRD